MAHPQSPVTVDRCPPPLPDATGGDAWLGSILAEAGVRHSAASGRQGFTSSDGAFHIWASEPVLEDPADEAASWDMAPLWNGSDGTVYGKSTIGSSLSYYYWRSGNADMWVQLDETRSSRSERGTFESIIAAAARQPYSPS